MYAAERGARQAFGFIGTLRDSARSGRSRSCAPRQRLGGLSSCAAESSSTDLARAPRTASSSTASVSASARPGRADAVGIDRCDRSAAAQTVVKRPPYSRGRANLVGATSIPNLVAARSIAAPQDPAQEGLARRASVDVGRVEERHARVERGIDHPLSARLVDPASEVVATEPDDADRQRADRAGLHPADATRAAPIRRRRGSTTRRRSAPSPTRRRARSGGTARGGQ